MNLKEVAAKYSDYIIEMRRHFHKYPEVSLHEAETSKRVREELEKMGYEVKSCGKGYSLTAMVEGGKPGKTFMLRADMDALPVQEETDVPYKSVNEGVMHACGHDCHIATLLTAAQILKDIKDEIAGRVLLCFQASEENAVGARDMIEGGVLEGVDACFGIHVWSEIPAGQVSVPAGPRMASCDMFSIDVQGQGGHGAIPHLAVDATVVTCAIVNNLQTIVSREIAPNETAVVTCGTVEAGTRWNVISDKGRITGTTRSFNAEVRNSFEERIRRIAEDTARMHRAEAKVEYTYLVAPTVNNEEIAALAQEAGASVLGENWKSDYGTTMGGEDMSEYLNRIPGAIALLGVGNEACDSCWAQHNPHYNVDESVLIKGAELYVQTALNYLNKYAG